jgi:hypothetical protein
MLIKQGEDYLGNLNPKFITIQFFQIQFKEKNKMLYPIIIHFQKNYDNSRRIVQDGIGVNIFQMGTTI